MAASILLETPGNKLCAEDMALASAVLIWFCVPTPVFQVEPHDAPCPGVELVAAVAEALPLVADTADDPDAVSAVIIFLIEEMEMVGISLLAIKNSASLAKLISAP